MADIERKNHLINMDDELEKKHNEILINEKISQIEGLKLRLKDLETIEAKRLKLKIEILDKEIIILQAKCQE